MTDGSHTGNGAFTSKWNNVITTGMFILFIGGAFWTLAYQPIARDQARIEQRLDRIEDKARRDEDQDTKRFVLKESSIEYRGRTDDAIKRNLEDLKMVRESLVPRGEHVEKWKSNDTQMLTLERKIEDIRKDIGTAYSLGDKIKELQRQIETLTTKKAE